MLIELDPVDRITADAVGAPGGRTFFIQARKGERVVTLLVEKQQVQLLAASVVEILSRLGRETEQGPAEEEMGLEEPVVPEWRAGRLSIGYEEDRDLLVLEAEELLPEDEEAEQELLEGTSDITGMPTLEVELEATEEEPERPGEIERELEREIEREIEKLDELEGLEELETLEGGGGLEEPVPEREPGRVRLCATRQQMLSLARHGATVCARGRPRCQLCGNPIEPEAGHRCPALNGHRETGR